MTPWRGCQLRNKVIWIMFFLTKLCAYECNVDVFLEKIWIRHWRYDLLNWSFRWSVAFWSFFYYSLFERRMMWRHVTSLMLVTESTNVAENNLSASSHLVMWILHDILRLISRISSPNAVAWRDSPTAIDQNKTGRTGTPVGRRCWLFSS